MASGSKDSGSSDHSFVPLVSLCGLGCFWPLTFEETLSSFLIFVSALFYPPLINRDMLAPLLWLITSNTASICLCGDTISRRSIRTQKGFGIQSVNGDVMWYSAVRNAVNSACLTTEWQFWQWITITEVKQADTNTLAPCWSHCAALLTCYTHTHTHPHADYLLKSVLWNGPLFMHTLTHRDGDMYMATAWHFLCHLSLC